jgi:hypothetical protein
VKWGSAPRSRRINQMANADPPAIVGMAVRSAVVAARTRILMGGTANSNLHSISMFTHPNPRRRAQVSSDASLRVRCSGGSFSATRAIARCCLSDSTVTVRPGQPGRRQSKPDAPILAQREHELEKPGQVELPLTMYVKRLRRRGPEAIKKQFG